MADTVTMPKLGFDMAEGTLVRWVKAEGETVNKGDVLAEIETDKATVEVESSFSGTLLRRLVDEGTPVPVGDPIAVIGQPGEAVDGGADGEKKAEAVPAPKSPDLTTDQKGPQAEGDEHHVAGSVAQADLAPAEVQGEQGAPQSAPERYQPTEKAIEESAATVTGEAQSVEDAGPQRASPLARRIALENNLNLSGVKGSGPGGRIVRRDVEAALKAPRPAPNPAATPARPAPAAPVPAAAASTPAPRGPSIALPMPAFGQVQAPQDERQPLDKLRTIIGKRMVESKQNLPHFYITSVYKMDALMALRKQVNEFLPEDQKVSVNDFVVKAVALALRSMPEINASIQGSEIVRHGHVNVGVAVALENGLMTVVCKDADQKPLRVIASEMKDMVARARSGKVRPDDIEGSTFSISNLGMYEVEEFIAIINPPEAAILAVGSALQVPVVENGEVKVGTRMKATISADHRVTDGAGAAKFMQSLRSYLENPMTLLI
jgi:pyruvate dehydrogenase E2 component (dihydrolipoamide acetyltransferase)